MIFDSTNYISNIGLVWDQIPMSLRDCWRSHRSWLLTRRGRSRARCCSVPSMSCWRKRALRLRTLGFLSWIVACSIPRRRFRILLWITTSLEGMCWCITSVAWVVVLVFLLLTLPNSSYRLIGFPLILSYLNFFVVYITY